MPVKKRPNQKRPGERNRFLERRRQYPLNPTKLKKKKPIRKSAEELYDSKRKSFRGSKVEEFSVGGIAKKVVKTILRDDYKPKLKNEKEVYSKVKQDYSDVIKNYEKTQKRKQRNRKAIGSIGGVTAATVVASNVKDKK